MNVNKLKRKLRSTAASLGQRLHGVTSKSYRTLANQQSRLVGDESGVEPVGNAGGLGTPARRESQRLRKFSSLETVVHKGAATLRRKISSFPNLPRMRGEPDDNTLVDHPERELLLLAPEDVSTISEDTEAEQNVNGAFSPCAINNVNSTRSRSRTRGDRLSRDPAQSCDVSPSAAEARDRNCGSPVCYPSSGGQGDAAGLRHKSDSLSSRSGTSSPGDTGTDTDEDAAANTISSKTFKRIFEVDDNAAVENTVTSIQADRASPDSCSARGGCSPGDGEEEEDNQWMSSSKLEEEEDPDSSNAYAASTRPSSSADTDMAQVPVTRKSSRRLSLTAGFELPRFRKRKLDKENSASEDAVSLQSLDVSGTASAKKKSKRSLLRVSASLINLVSPSRNKNDTCGFKVPSSPLRPLRPLAPPTASPYRPPRPSPAKRRVQLSWVDSFGSCGGEGDGEKCVTSALSHHEIKRQEAIYELYQGERDILEDLTNIIKFYREPLIKLGLMSQEETHALFGNIESLLPVHEELINRLREQRKPDGRTEHIGQHIHDWVNRLSVYVQYCANQIKAKAVFDEKKSDSAIEDFLQRCLASPFSRKLDVWTLLDGARGRFVKYPLLIRAILKYTQNSDDAYYLENSLEQLESIIRKADDETGRARCEHSKSSLVYLFEDQKIPEIEQSTALLCSGCMKNVKGSKLFLFLYDRVAVVTRSTHQQGRQMYQVYRQPIPTSDLLVQDLPDGEVKLGSFRNAFGQGNQIAKNIIRISFRDSEKGQSHTLLANDEHDKRQWMQAFPKVTACLEVIADNNSANNSKVKV